MDALNQYKVLCLALSKDAFICTFLDKDYLEFGNHRKQIEHYNIIYADFESYVEEIHVGSTHSTSAYSHHKPMSHAYLFVTEDSVFQMARPKLYLGEQAHIKFLEEIIDLAERVTKCYNDKETGIKMTEADQVSFEAADKCGHCSLDFSLPGIVKVRYHNHQKTKKESNYRKAVCSNCNLVFTHE
ncbi:unnamed protein product [Bemisia tabaci]|uniref:Uncharacterized protein n=1 Tax=Bemisia tabaci TaxID=7038 RepID=A0A9P0AP07_BEMTA|nr:unnamed protein product [Bemisia tabaci]